MNITINPKILRLALASLMVLPLLSHADDKTAKTNTNGPGLKPVRIEYRTLGGFQYSIDDRLLVHDKDFEDLVAPLNDYEALRLIKKSEASEFDSGIIRAVGFAGFATGIIGILTTSSSHRTPFWVTAIGGAVLFDTGGFFQLEAQSSKFNCVQRYNRFAHGEEQVLPKGPEDEKSLLNFDSGKDSSTPKTSKP